MRELQKTQFRRIHATHDGSILIMQQSQYSPAVKLCFNLKKANLA